MCTRGRPCRQRRRGRVGAGVESGFAPRVCDALERRRVELASTGSLESGAVDEQPSGANANANANATEDTDAAADASAEGQATRDIAHL